MLQEEAASTGHGGVTDEFRAGSTTGSRQRAGDRPLRPRRAGRHRAGRLSRHDDRRPPGGWTPVVVRSGSGLSSALVGLVGALVGRLGCLGPLVLGLADGAVGAQVLQLDRVAGGV